FHVSNVLSKLQLDDRRGLSPDKFAMKRSLQEPDRIDCAGPSRIATRLSATCRKSLTSGLNEKVGGAACPPKRSGGAGGIRTHEWRFCRPAVDFYLVGSSWLYVCAATRFGP